MCPSTIPLTDIAKYEGTGGFFLNVAHTELFLFIVIMTVTFNLPSYPVRGRLFLQVYNNLFKAELLCEQVGKIVHNVMRLFYD